MLYRYRDPQQIGLADLALVRGRGIVFRHHCQSMATNAGKHFRDGAVVPFE